MFKYLGSVDRIAKFCALVTKVSDAKNDLEHLVSSRLGTFLEGFIRK